MSKLFMPLLIAIDVHGHVIHETPKMDHDTTLHLRNDLNIEESWVSDEAGETPEGITRIRMMTGIMKTVASRVLPDGGPYWEEPYEDQPCYLAQYHMRRADQVEVRIRASDIEDLDSGDQFTLEETITTVDSSIRTNTHSNSKSDTQKKTVSAGIKLKLKHNISAITLGATYSNAHTSNVGSSTSFVNKATQKDTITKTSKDTYKCEEGYHCRVQLWTYDVMFKGSAPLVPMMKPGCVLQQSMETTRDSPGKIYGGVMEQLRRQGNWWYTGGPGRWAPHRLHLSEQDSYNWRMNHFEWSPKQRHYDGECGASQAPNFRDKPNCRMYGPDEEQYFWFSTCGTDQAGYEMGCEVLGEDIQVATLHGNMAWLDKENAEYYSVKRRDGQPATSPNIPFPVKDDVPNYPYKGEEEVITVLWDDLKWYPTDEETQRKWDVRTYSEKQTRWNGLLGPAKGEKMPQWKWTDLSTGSFDSSFDVEFLKSKAWDMSFPARDLDGKIMASIVNVQIPYGKEKRNQTKPKKVKVDVLYENINLDISNFN